MNILPATGLSNAVYGGITVRTSFVNRDGATFWPAAIAAERDVVLERRRLAAHLRVDPERISDLRQRHGTGIVQQPGAAAAEADAHWTDRPGEVLLLNVADCCPVLLEDERSGSIGAAHCGWRGTAENLPGRLVQEMCSAVGTEPRAFRAWLGPCAGPDRYEVGPEVAERFSRWKGTVVPGSRGTDRYLINLRAAIVQQLVDVGVDAAWIVSSGDCTISDRRFHSYRRDGIRSGRMAAFLFRREE